MKKLILCSLLLAGAFLARSAEVTVPIEKYSLKNGLRVILSQDNAVPVVIGLHDLRRRGALGGEGPHRASPTCSST